MTTIEELKNEKINLQKERSKLIIKFKEELIVIKNQMQEGVREIDNKILILDKQIKNLRKPYIAKNVRAIKGEMKL